MFNIFDKIKKFPKIKNLFAHVIFFFKKLVIPYAPYFLSI